MPDLAQHLRHWGLKVVEIDGWRTRGRPFSFEPRGIICHHDASSISSGNWGAREVIVHGRSDLTGPLSQFVLARDGQVAIAAAGYANHAGSGGPVDGIPEDMGNTHCWGIEACNNGVGERWEKAQLNAYYRLCAALMDYSNISRITAVFGHKEWTSRKIDPAGLSMTDFRNQVRLAKEHGPTVVTVSLANVKPGLSNLDVLRVKRRLQRRGFFDAEMTDFFGPGLLAAVKKFQRSLGVPEENINGVPGKFALNKLGFRVEP